MHPVLLLGFGMFMLMLTALQPSEADRMDEENRRKTLSSFTYDLSAFISGGEETNNPVPELPAPISNDLLAGAGMTSPTRVSPPTRAISLSPTGPARAGASRAKPPAGAPPPPGSTVATSASEPVPGRPPPPSGPPQAPGMQGSRAPGFANKMAPTADGVKKAGLSNQAPRAKSMSPHPTGSLEGFEGLAIGASISTREGRSSSVDVGVTVGAGKGKRPLPPEARKIMEMGFSERKVRAALERTNGDAGQAVEWLLSNPSLPDVGGPGDALRPSSPSMMSSPLSKSIRKKPKPGAPQNSVFDEEAFTPVLIPAKQAPHGAGHAPQAWINPPGAGGGGGGVGVARPPNPGLVASDSLALVPSGVGLGQGLGAGAGRGHGSGLVRPRSTSDLISALDPDAVERFDFGAAPGPQARGQRQLAGGGQGSPVSPNAGEGPSAGGMQFRRQSAPTGLSPSKLTPGMPTLSPRGQPRSESQVQQQLPNNTNVAGQLLQRQESFNNNNSYNNSNNQPVFQVQQRQPAMVNGTGPPPQQQPQLQPRPTTGPSSNRRPPPPSGPAAVGGSTAMMGAARPLVPRGPAAIGGSMPRTGSAPASGVSPALVPVGVGPVQATPQFQTGQGVVVPQQQPQQQQQPRLMQQARGMGMQGSQPGQQQPQGGLGAGRPIQQLEPTSGNMQQGFARTPQQQQQQFAGQSQGLGMTAGGQPQGLPVMNSGQQMARPTGMSMNVSQQFGVVSSQLMVSFMLRSGSGMCSRIPAQQNAFAPCP